MTRRKKKVLTIVAVVLIAAVITMLGAIFIPRVGKKVINIFGAGEAFSLKTIQNIKKESGEDFKILLMTDIQLWSNLSDNAKTFALMDKLVKETKPHLIVLPGDNVSGMTTDLYVYQLIAKMDSYKIPWAPTFGNHDSEGNATLEWQADRFEESKYCMFERGYSNLYGVGNYAINVTENEKIVQTLFFFDNGRYYDYGDRENEIYMGYEQIAWYKWVIEGIAAETGAIVPSMVFSHFAQPEFKEAIEKLAVKIDKVYYVPEELGFGYCKYLPGVASKNSGFIDEAKRLGSTKYVFAGHDHENNASILYEGITYTYGLKTGCSPRYWNDATEYGGTVATIKSANDVTVKNCVIETLK